MGEHLRRGRRAHGPGVAEPALTSLPPLEGVNWLRACGSSQRPAHGGPGSTTGTRTLAPRTGRWPPGATQRGGERPPSAAPARAEIQWVRGCRISRCVTHSGARKGASKRARPGQTGGMCGTRGLVQTVGGGYAGRSPVCHDLMFHAGERQPWTLASRSNFASTVATRVREGRVELGLAPRLGNVHLQPCLTNSHQTPAKIVVPVIRSRACMWSMMGRRGLAALLAACLVVCESASISGPPSSLRLRGGSYDEGGGGSYG